MPDAQRILSVRWRPAPTLKNKNKRSRLKQKNVLRWIMMPSHNDYRHYTNRSQLRQRIASFLKLVRTSPEARNTRSKKCYPTINVMCTEGLFGSISSTTLLCNFFGSRFLTLHCIGSRGAKCPYPHPCILLLDRATWKTSLCLEWYNIHTITTSNLSHSTWSVALKQYRLEYSC